MGWTVLPEYIRNDEGITGAALGTRTALLSFVQDAKKDRPPFDCILIDSTSRYCRELSDALKVTKILKFHGVFLYFVTQRLDTRERYARKLQTVYGMQDEDFLETHRENVHRGLKGVALKGYHTGGSHYGYRRILIYHPTDKDEHGRPAVDHVILEVDPEEAAVVLEIFKLRGQRKSLRDITKHLNRKSVLGPRGGGWAYSTVKYVLKDQLYRGIKRWNAKKNEMDPESYAVRRQARPQTEWVVRDLPELRIISEELWEKVQEVNRNAKRFRQQLGGENRTISSRTYPFSGSLKCGLCLGSMCIISGKAGGRFTRYGCRAHRSEGKCTNAATIRRDVLEDQLLNALVEKLQPPVLEEYLQAYQARIEGYLAKEANAGEPDKAIIVKRVEELKKQESNIVRAIASLGGSDALLSELTKIEAERKDLSGHLVRLADPRPLGTSFEEFRGFVWQKAAGLKSVLLGDRALAKETIKRVVGQLVLTPYETPAGAFFEVSGKVDLFAGEAPRSAWQFGSSDGQALHTPLSLVGVALDPDKPTQASTGIGLTDDVEIAV